MGAFSDLSNKTFGKLRVSHRSDVVRNNKIHWHCICECGTEKIIVGASLKNGMTKSCGCFRQQVTGDKRRTHGLTNTKAYSIWCAMKARCSNPKSDHWDYYGGRGIQVCDKWANSFQAFHDDMGACPDNYSIERVDVNGNYSPENCKWIPLSEQHLNKR